MAIEVAKNASPVTTSVRRTTGLPNPVAFTACGWFKYVWTDLTSGSFSSAIVLCLDAGAATTNYVQLYKDSASGAILVAGQDAAAATSSGTIASITLNNWYWFAIVNRGIGANDLTGYVSAADTNVISSQSTQGRTFAPTRIGFAYDPFTSGTGGGDNWSGDMANIRVWNRALSVAELANEKYSMWAQARTGLNSDSPCFNAADHNGTVDDLRDYSGNGYHWTESDALRNHDNLSGNNIPPVSYGGRPIQNMTRAVINAEPVIYDTTIRVPRRRRQAWGGRSMGVDVREWW